MGGHGMPFHLPIEVSEGTKLAMALYGTHHRVYGCHLVSPNGNG